MGGNKRYGKPVLNKDKLKFKAKPASSSKRAKSSSESSLEVDGDLHRYLKTMEYYLANSYTIDSYKVALESRADYYKSIKQENLYAFVLPGGHGKTYLAQKYGFIDIDHLVQGPALEELCNIRKRLFTETTVEWVGHNQRWYELCYKTLYMMTFDRPTVIMVHSEECGYELGARVIGTLVLDDKTFFKNIEARTDAGKVFSEISREFVWFRSTTKPRICSSNLEIESLIVDSCNYWNIPIHSPYRFSRAYENGHYAHDVPDWLLVGDVEDHLDDMALVLYLEKAGKIPKECVDDFVWRNVRSGRAYGFGVTMNDWGRLCGQLVGAIGVKKNVQKGQDLFEVFPPLSAAEKHRVNVTLRRLESEEHILDDKYCKMILDYHVGEKHVFVAGLISHWLGIGSKNKFGKKLMALYLVKLSEYSKLLSEFHNLIRLSNYYCTTVVSELDRQGLMYMNMLVGREIYDADWKKVLDERGPNAKEEKFVSFDPVRRTWTKQQYDIDFEKGLAEAYEKMISKPRKVNVTSFVDFWKRRRQWIAKGSPVLNTLPKEMLKYTIDLYDGVVKSIEMRHNKKSLFEAHEVVGLINDSMEDFNLTKAVPKLNETGKHRELLPGTLAHYLIFSYVLYVAELQEQVGSVRLNAPADEKIAYYDGKMEAEMTHMLYDWANFNSQHSVDDMRKVVNWLSLIPTAPADYGPFCQLISESFTRMALVDPDGQRHDLKKGLFSGWRGTSWINGVLNFVYVYIGVKCCERLFPQFEPVYFDHGGDDLDVAFRDPSDAVRMMAVMDAIGYEAKAIKQMIDKKSEFFRNTITHEGVYASPTRALANFVSGNWEGGGAKTLFEKSMSILDQVGKLQRRGVDPKFCLSLTKMCMAHWLKVKTDDEWFEIKPEIVHGSMTQGGLGVPDENGRVWLLDRDLELVDVEEFRVTLPAAYCTEDYVDLLEEQLERTNLKLEGRQVLVNKLAKQSYDLKQFEDQSIFSRLNKLDVKKIGERMVITPVWDEVVFDEFLYWVKIEGDVYDIPDLELMSEIAGHVSWHGKLLTKSEIAFVVLGKRINEMALDWRPNIYYRRLVPDFLGTIIDRYVRYRADHFSYFSETDMDYQFDALCYMCSLIYDHHA